MRAARWLAVALLALAASPVHADEPRVTATAIVGFDGTFVEGAWTPVLVTLEAPPGAKPLSGRVVVEPLPLERVASFAAPFELAASAEGGRARVLLGVPARGDLSFTLHVEDERGSEIATVTPSVRRVDQKDRVVLVTRSSGLAAFADAPGRGPSLPNGPAVRLARLGAESEDEVRARFPSRGWLLQGASAVVLADQSAGPGVHALARDAERMRALEEWVEEGGTAFVVGGGAPFWAGTPLEPLLPVVAQGPRSEAPLEFLGSVRATVSEATRRDEPGVVLREGTDARVLVAERALGCGRVVFLAFDPDAPELRGSVELGRSLRALLGPPGTAALPISPERLSELSTRAFQEIAPLGVTGLAAIGLAALAAAFVAGPVAARRRGNPLLVLLAPLLSAVLGAAIVLVARLARGPSEARSLAVVFVESPGDAWCVEDVALVAGRRASFEVELASGTIPLPLERPKHELVDFRVRRSSLVVPVSGPLVLAPIDALARAVVPLRLGARVAVAGVGAPERGTVAPGARASLPLARVRLEEGVLVIEARGPEPLPAGLALLAERTTHAALVAPTPTVAPGTVARVRFDPPRELLELLREEDARGSLWERSPVEASRGLALRTLGLLEPRAARGGTRADGPAAAWLAIPAEAPVLEARIVERERESHETARSAATASLPEVKASRLGVYLYPAEGAP